MMQHTVCRRHIPRFQCFGSYGKGRRISIFYPNWLRLVRQALITIGMLAIASSASAGEYLLQPGDTVEITVQGVPELKRRSIIREDGYIPFPIIGNVTFSNLSLSEVRKNIHDLLVSKDVVAHPDVTVDLAEVRPLYILGDVAKPGSFPFKPEYTIRHALSLAGGVDVSNLRNGGNNVLQIPEVAAQFETYRIEFVRHQARVRRLQSELAGKTAIDFGNFASLAVPESIFGRVMAASEEQHLAATSTAIHKDRSSYSQSLEQANRQLEALEQQQKVEDQGLQIQTADVERIKVLAERGLASASRITDEQRSILLTKARLTSTMAQVASVKRSIEELRRQIDKVAEARQVEALKELQEALVGAESAYARMHAASEKMHYLGAGGQYGTSGHGGVEFVIFRKWSGVEVTVKAEAGTALMPGDVIEVTIPRRRDLGLMSERIPEPTASAPTLNK